MPPRVEVPAQSDRQLLIDAEPRIVRAGDEVRRREDRVESLLDGELRDAVRNDRSCRTLEIFGTMAALACPREPCERGSIEAARCSQLDRVRIEYRLHFSAPNLLAKLLVSLFTSRAQDDTGEGWTSLGERLEEGLVIVATGAQVQPKRRLDRAQHARCRHDGISIDVLVDECVDFMVDADLAQGSLESVAARFPAPWGLFRNLVRYAGPIGP